MYARGLVIGFLALVFGALACGDSDGTTGATPELKVEPEKVEFGAACPKPTDPNLKVEAVSRTVTVKNVGAAELDLNKFAVEDSRKDVFVVDASKVPQLIASGESVDIPITFLPKASGPVFADLSVVGDSDQSVTVKLYGEGKGLPPNPGLEMSCPGGQLGADKDLCAPPAELPTIYFLDTTVKYTGEMSLKLKNLGCPNLEITNLTVTTDTADGAAADSFALADGQPTNFSVVAGAPTEVKLRFWPRMNDMHYGKLSFDTNDPKNPHIEIEVKGYGVVPDLVVTTKYCCGYPSPTQQDPQCCDFKPVLGGCDGRMDVKNLGNKPLTITKIALLNNNPMFVLGGTLKVGDVLPVDAVLPGAIEIGYQPASTKEGDVLEIVSDVGGAARIELRGGTPPVIGTETESDPTGATLNFNYGGVGLELMTDYWKPITVTNVETYGHQLDLLIKNVTIEQSQQVFFVETTPKGSCLEALKANDTLAVKESKQLCVRFKSTSLGGDFRGNLKVFSNDPLFPAGYAVRLEANTLCNANPVADVSVPSQVSCSDTNPCTATGAACSDAGECLVQASPQDLRLNAYDETKNVLVLSGELSYDLRPDATRENECLLKDYGEVAGWQWTLKAKPALSTTAKVTAEANPSRAKFEFDKAGLYRIGLIVTDKTGRTSAESFFDITVKSPL